MCLVLRPEAVRRVSRCRAVARRALAVAPRRARPRHARLSETRSRRSADPAGRSRRPPADRGQLALDGGELRVVQRPLDDRGRELFGAFQRPFARVRGLELRVRALSYATSKCVSGMANRSRADSTAPLPTHDPSSETRVTTTTASASKLRNASSIGPRSAVSSSLAPPGRVVGRPRDTVTSKSGTTLSSVPWPNLSPIGERISSSATAAVATTSTFVTRRSFPAGRG